MNVGDVIKCVVIAVGANDNSFVEPIEGEKVNIPIIIESKLRYKGKYEIKITRITQNFMIGEAVDGRQ
jgi:hypothetical protein